LNAYRVIPNLVEHPGDTSTIGNGRHPRAHYFCKVLLGLDFKDEATSQEYRTYCHKVESPSIALAPYDGPVAPVARGTLYWRGVDVSHWDVGQPYFSASGPGPRHYRQDLFDVLLDAGVNVVRFNIFLDGLHHPFSLVHALAVADAAASRGLGLCAVLHLSDTWAYPSEQTKPLAWRDLALPELAQALRTYTHEVVAQLCSQGTPPAIVQVGNEITNGMVWPHPSEGTAVGGKLRAGDPGSWGNFTQLLRAGIDGVREAAADADKQPEVMLHFDNGGDTAAASSWFTQLDRHGVDYDIVGVSIHDHWSPGGKLEAVAGLRAIPPALPGKQIVVAETSHPYRPADRFPATPADSDPDHTPEGQADYLRSALKLLRDNPNGTGLFWWGSVFFNDTVEHCPDFLRARALFVPDGSALPALRRFRL
jgi:arabinogalactan endo-1,4-beta-galactosidase